MVAGNEVVRVECQISRCDMKLLSRRSHVLAELVRSYLSHQLCRTNGLYSYSFQRIDHTVSERCLRTDENHVGLQRRGLRASSFTAIERPSDLFTLAKSDDDIDVVHRGYLICSADFLMPKKYEDMRTK